MFSVTGTSFDPVNKIWSGPKKKDIYGPDMTLGEVALHMLSLNPCKVVQVMDSTGEELTAGQLLQNSKTIAKKFLRLGLQVGDVIGISGNNTTHLASVTIGAFLCGTPINALYPGFDKESIQVIFRVTNPKIIFCDVENYEIMKSAMADLDPNVNIYLLNGNSTDVPNVNELLADDGSDLQNISFPCFKINGNHTAAILCSSGTTGTPKGAQCSHRTLLNCPLTTNLPVDSVLFTFSTLYWASGLWMFTLAIINGAKKIITDQPFNPEYFLHLLERYKLTHIISGPHHVAQIIQNATPNTKERLSSLQTLFCAGSKVPQVVSEKFNMILGNKPRVGLTVSYGMSELSCMLTGNDEGPDKRREGTEGKLNPNLEVRILGKNGEYLGVNSPGIVSIRSPYKWSGYFRNPEATNKAYVDGWLITGDIGYFDDDGYFHICTRDNDVFKSNNFQIYPEQIEEVIMQLPGVLEACIFGVPDIVASNLTACAIVRAHNEAGEKLSASDVITHVKNKMADIYHIKGGVSFVESLPKTGSGKVQRRKIYDVIQNANKQIVH